MSNYEQAVMKHYSDVAKNKGASPLSTMENEYVRKRETKAIIQTIKAFKKFKGNDRLKIADIGCGNGYTLSVLAKKFKNFTFLGIEKNDDLRQIAINRFKNVKNVKIIKGDILDEITASVDIAYCQRVIINLLDENDQKRALKNIGKIVKNGGIFACLECMKAALDNLNQARAEYDLSPIKPSFHNLYMDEEIFANLGNFQAFKNKNLPKKNFLSTHYYISRVLHDLTLNSKPFMRNSHFVSFMTKAFSKNIGEYSPIQFFCFKKL